MPVFLSHTDEPGLSQGLMLAYAPYSVLWPGMERGLSEAEQAELGRMRHARRRDEFVVSRHLLQQLFGRMFPEAEAPFAVLRDVGGKPYGLSGQRVVPMAIAHSETHAFVAMARSADLGLDVEPTRRAEHPDLRRRMLAPAEQEDPALQAFGTVRLWSVKESILKLEGTGLRRSMRSVRLSCLGGTLVAEVSGRAVGVNSFVRDEHWIAISEYISAPHDTHRLP